MLLKNQSVKKVLFLNQKNKIMRKSNRNQS